MLFEQKFRRYNFYNLEALHKAQIGDNYHTIWFGYASLNVMVDEHKPLVDLNSFVNAVGGGLGLFLGFSIIDTLFFVSRFIFRK